jgi:hypothetical protein
MPNEGVSMSLPEDVTPPQPEVTVRIDEKGRKHYTMKCDPIIFTSRSPDEAKQEK